MSTPQQLPIDVAQPEVATTDIAPSARALVALKSTETERELAELAAKHVGLVEIKNKAGRDRAPARRDRGGEGGDRPP